MQPISPRNDKTHRRYLVGCTFDFSLIFESDSLRKREEMSECDHVTDVALSLCRIYLGCKDAFPTSQMKDQWAAIVWREACIKAGADLDLFPPYDLASPIPTKALHVLIFRFSLQTETSSCSLRRR